MTVSPPRLTLEHAGLVEAVEKMSQLGRRSRRGMRPLSPSQQVGRLDDAHARDAAAQERVHREALAAVLLGHDDERRVELVGERRQVGERAEDARVDEDAADLLPSARSGSPSTR